MNTQLIFLHIPKAAGTAFRNTVTRNYPGEYHWWGLTDEQEDLSDFNVIGGHQPFEYYADLASEKIYLAIVREPVSRVISLYNYFVDPPHDLELTSRWVNEFNLDPDSLANTIKNSRHFRYEVENYQCFYLSGHRDFEKARAVIESQNFIVGCMDHIDLFIDHLKSMLDWNTIYFPRTNEANTDYAGEYYQDKELIGLIEEITSEDRKLYEFILEEKVFEHLDKKNIDLSTIKRVPCLTETACRSIKLSLVSDDRSIVNNSAGETITIDVAIYNNSYEIIPVSGKHAVSVGYHWFHADDNTRLPEGTRSDIAGDIMPGDSVQLPMTITMPEKPGEYRLSISLVVEHIRWFDECDPDHALTFDVMVNEPSVEE